MKAARFLYRVSVLSLVVGFGLACTNEEVVGVIVVTVSAEFIIKPPSVSLSVGEQQGCWIYEATPHSRAQVLQHTLMGVRTKHDARISGQFTGKPATRR